MSAKKEKKTVKAAAPVEVATPETKLTAAEQSYIEKYPKSLRAIMLQQGIKVVEV